MCGMVMLFSTSSLNIAGYELKVFTWKNVFEREQVSPENQVAIVSLEKRLEEVEKKEAEYEAQRRRKKEVLEIPDTTGIRGKTGIELPEDNPAVLQHFFQSLANLADDSPVIRIVHYGDSQLEGDRITEYLRNKLQTKFGGCGVGFVPVMELENSRSTLSQKASRNWRKYACFGTEKRPSEHKKYGLNGTYFTFTEDTDELANAWIEFYPTNTKYQRAKQIEEITLLYRNPYDSLRLKAVWNEVEIFKDNLPLSPELGIAKLSVVEDLEKCHIELMANGKPEILGMLLDCNTGIAVDNIAMRGSSGADFTNISRTSLATLFTKLNVKLLILQFGVNVVPYLAEDDNYYEKMVYTQLRYLKTIAPDVDILVVGVSDMARKEDTEMTSYPTIPYIRSAQREAAFKAGCAFWDLYSAMGGKNSIVSWVAAKPALAAKDYTHFTREGAKLVGEMLYNELMTEYAKYLLENNLNK
jgi:lysophospholipase L1-like esterase